jgi:hypothetical protein
MTVCEHPAYVPTRERPLGECGEPATHAVALGDTGRWLPLCQAHADACTPRARLVPIDKVPER